MREADPNDTHARQLASELFQIIEQHVIYWVACSQEMFGLFMSIELAEGLPIFYPEVMSLKRIESPYNLHLHDMEDFASQWAAIVPDAANVRAALAHLIGQSYRLNKRGTTDIQAALHLDDEEVQAAYLRLYGRPLETIFIR
jgi:hypothetical protein